MFIHNSNVNYNFINDLDLPNVSLSSSRVFLSQEDSFKVDSSMFVVEGSYEEGYVNDQQFQDVCIMLDIDPFNYDYDDTLWLYNNIARVNKELIAINKSCYLIINIYVKSLDELYEELHHCDNGVLAYHYTVDDNEYTVHSGLYAY